jgi:SulP family sulfate permease
MDKVPYVDQSGLYAMEEAIHNLKSKNIDVLIVGLYGQTKNMFDKIDIVPGLVSENNCFDTIEEMQVYLK